MSFLKLSRAKLFFNISGSKPSENTIYCWNMQLEPRLEVSHVKYKDLKNGFHLEEHKWCSFPTLALW